MNRNLRIALFTAIAVCFYGQSFAAVDGTMGTPLGGVGAGAVKFCAHSGAFYSVETTPCAMKDFQILAGANFQLYTKRAVAQVKSPLTAVVTDGRAADDAIYPIDTAFMGVTDNVAVSLLAFSPMCFDSVNLMCLPYAFFEFKVTNTGTSSVDAAIAFQIPTGSVPVWIAGKGMQSTAANALNRAVYAASSSAGAVISAGSDSDGFAATGQCNNAPSGNLNKVAVKVSLAASASGTIRFVYAWYNGFPNTYQSTDPFTGITTPCTIGPDRLYYTNLVSLAGSVADIGLAVFDLLRDNALRIVTRMRGSSIPEWIKDQTLNSLCNLTTNAMYTKDGRLGFTEGQWNTNGTMDQMWHGRIMTSMGFPALAWKELEWWARTQKTDTAEGQIHHDMGTPMEKLRGWEADANLPDYGWMPDANPWVDLNVGFIVSVYETYIATGDKTKLDYFWPYVKKTGQRIFNQVKTYGSSQYPFTFETSLNTYDQKGFDLNAFSTGMATVAFRIMADLAAVYNDTALQIKNMNAFDTSRTQFEKRYLKNNFPLGPAEQNGRYKESVLAGQWLAFYLGFGQIYSTAGLDYGFSVQDSGYQAPTSGLKFPGGSYDEWVPYLVSHYGALRLMTGKPEIWRGLQYDWYERHYLNRNLVFNQQLGISVKVTTPKYLADNASVYNQYISIPVLWRNYYTIIGYHRNKPTGELWLEPNLPTEMNHTMQNAMYMSPEGYGSISYSESGTNFRSQAIYFKPDNPTAVTSLYVKDKSTDSVVVKVNGQVKPFTRIGQGYGKELKIDVGGMADASGIMVTVVYSDDNVGIRTGAKASALALPQTITLLASPNGRIVFPAMAQGKEKLVSVYSVTGARVYAVKSMKAAIDLFKDFGLSRGTYIVKVRVK